MTFFEDLAKVNGGSLSMYGIYGQSFRLNLVANLAVGAILITYTPLFVRKKWYKMKSAYLSLFFVNIKDSVSINA